MSAYRDDVAALAARQEALTSEVADKTRQLEAATHLLEEARAKARLPILDNIRVASPCTVDWAQMSGDDQVRACGQCQKNVYNLSELTREEAEALIIKTNGDLCGRYYQRKDGTILLKDCEIGVARNRKRKLIAVGAATFLGGFAGLYALTHRHKAEFIAVQGGLSAEPIGVELAEPVEPPPPVETVELPPVPEDSWVTMGLIAAPRDEAAELQHRIDELHQQKAELSERIHEAELAQKRLRQDKPRQPRKVLKIVKELSSQEPSEPTLEQVWREEQ